MKGTKSKEMIFEGMLWFTKGDYEKSIEHLSRALKSDPKQMLAYMTRGVAYLKTDKAGRAVDDFDKVIELDGDYDRAYHLRGVAYTELGRLERSLKDFDRAIELNPDYGAAYLSRANVHQEMGHEEEAHEDMEMVRRIQERNIQTFSDDQNVLNTKDVMMEA
jgi:Tfp pilus assembly protein PilF